MMIDDPSDTNSDENTHPQKINNLVYQELPRLLRDQIENTLDDDAASSDDKITAVFSANMYHDLDFAAACVLSVLRGEDPRSIVRACGVATVIMQTRWTNKYTDQFVECIRSAKQRFPDMSSDVDIELDNILDFKVRINAEPDLKKG